MFIIVDKHLINMARAKVTAFPQRENLAADYCKALGHPARERIVALLLEHGPLSFTTLVQAVGLHPTTVCQHLRKLERVSLLEAVDIAHGQTGYGLRKLAYREMCVMLLRFVEWEKMRA